MPKINSSIYSRVVEALRESVKRSLGKGLLLSGGLDTSIIAYLASEFRKPDCVTVALKGAPAPDIGYAQKAADILGLKHYIHYFGENELEEGIRKSIEILKSFDPMEIRNSAAAYVALKIAKERGLPSVMTGDGADELFAGYSFYFELTKKQLDAALKEMWQNMNFSSIELGKSLGIEVKTPFLDPETKSFAMSLDSGFKVRAEKGETFGKWVLRKAFEIQISPEIAWRTKAPLEVGTGTTTLPSLYDAGISELTFTRKKKNYFHEDEVNIRSKEHLVYYEIYKSFFGIPGDSVGEGRRCPECRAGIVEKAAYCRTCGAYPI